MHAPYCDYPKDIPLQTPFGEVRLAVTDGHHVYVEFSQPERPLGVREQLVWGDLHLWRQPDGTFGPDGRSQGGFEDRFAPHTGSYRKPASQTATAKLLDGLVDAVTAWAKENEQTFEHARVGRSEAHMQALRAEIATLETQLRSRRAELAVLEGHVP